MIASQFSTDEHEMLSKSNIDYVSVLLRLTV
jgi:hypothetical protein